MNKDNTVRQAGGFIIQLLPGAEEATIAALEKTIGELEPVTTMLNKGMTPEDILELILGQFGLEILDKMPIQFTCNCTKSRVEKALIKHRRQGAAGDDRRGQEHRSQLPVLQQAL